MGESLVGYIASFLNIITELIFWLILVRVVLSWFPVSDNRFTDFIRNVTEPFLALARLVTPKLGMIDISPLIALLGIQLIRTLLIMLLNYVAPYLIFVLS